MFQLKQVYSNAFVCVLTSKKEIIKTDHDCFLFVRRSFLVTDCETTESLCVYAYFLKKLATRTPKIIVYMSCRYA